MKRLSNNDKRGEVSLMGLMILENQPVGSQNNPLGLRLWKLSNSSQNRLTISIFNDKKSSGKVSSYIHE